MTKEQTIDLLHKVKANYQEFAIEDYVIEEWYKSLKPYDEEDVIEMFKQHLKGEYQKKIPRLNYFINNLKTPEQKEKSKEINVRCSICNRFLPYRDNDSHLARHSSIYYIKSREHYLNKKYNEEKLLNATDEEFDRFYDKFLEELYCVIENGDEKKRLERIVFYQG